MRIWRNWQTRMVQVHVKAISCRFKSCYPHHVEAKFALLRLFLCKKVIRPLPCFSFFTKSHARLTCSVVNALTTTRCRCQLFVTLILPHSSSFFSYKKCMVSRAPYTYPVVIKFLGFYIQRLKAVFNISVCDAETLHLKYSFFLRPDFCEFR